MTDKPKTGILGIDPGKHGAIAWLSLAHAGQAIAVDVPTFELSKASARGRKRKLEIDRIQLARLVGQMSETAQLVVLEQPMAMPGQSSVATFETGRAFGQLEGILAALRLPVEVVAPAIWKKRLNVPKDKDGARARASALMPESAGLWTRAKDDGRAEAALLAYYGRRFILGEERAL